MTSDSPIDECYRCGYDIRGIANDQACPECGLLAERSRRVTDELHQTRPRWVRSLSRGTNLILLAILTAVAWSFVAARRGQFPNFGAPPIDGPDYDPGLWTRPPALFGLDGIDASATFLLLGVFLLTRREGYAPADRADRWLRLALRLGAMIPLGAMIFRHLYLNTSLFNSFRDHWGSGLFWSWFISMALAAPIPLLVFLRLRGLAPRVRIGKLNEHCMIVGVGGSATVLYIPVALLVFEEADNWGLGYNWESHSAAPQLIIVLLIVAMILFIPWSLYLLLRFAWAFRLAAKEARRKWIRDDRSLSPPPT